MIIYYMVKYFFLFKDLQDAIVEIRNNFCCASDARLSLFPRAFIKFFLCGYVNV